MEIVQTWIGSRGAERAGPETDLVGEYVERSTRYTACRTQGFPDEGGFWSWLERGAKGRTVVALLDGGGRQMTSQGFAGRVGQWRDEGVRRLVLGIGGADGWSAESRGRADVLVSLGLMTLPHQMARVVLAEQVYRALTILAGHPYHTGH